MRVFWRIILALIYSAAMIAIGVMFGTKALALAMIACLCTAFAIGTMIDVRVVETEPDEPNDGSDDEC